MSCCVRTKQTITSRADLESGLSSLREALVRSNDAKELRVTFPVRFTPLVSRAASNILIISILTQIKRIYKFTQFMSYEYEIQVVTDYYSTEVSIVLLSLYLQGRPYSLQNTKENQQKPQEHLQKPPGTHFIIESLTSFNLKLAHPHPSIMNLGGR